MVDEVTKRFVELGKRIHGLGEAWKAQADHQQGWSFADLFSELVDYMRPSQADIAEIARRIGGLPKIPDESTRAGHSPTLTLGDVPPLSLAGEGRTAEMIKLHVKDDKIQCLICKKWFRTLGYHLKHSHGKTTDQYLADFGLTEDFPLVAPSYSELRRTNIQRIREQNGGLMGRGAGRQDSTDDEGFEGPPRAKRGRKPSRR